MRARQKSACVGGEHTSISKLEKVTGICRFAAFSHVAHVLLYGVNKIVKYIFTDPLRKRLLGRKGGLILPEANFSL